MSLQSLTNHSVSTACGSTWSVLGLSNYHREQSNGIVQAIVRNITEERIQTALLDEVSSKKCSLARLDYDLKSGEEILALVGSVPTYVHYEGRTGMKQQYS